MTSWFRILSELFVNLAAAWFGLIFIEPRINPNVDLVILTIRFLFGILSLLVAKYFRDKNYEKLY